MELSKIDWIVIGIFFVLMIIIGIWANTKNKSTVDYFTAGGKLPWWLSGISHHVSGYSGAVFVAYAGLAYTHGISIYVWWSLTIGIAILSLLKVFPVLWVRLRTRFSIQSPLEYLINRYGVNTQQFIAWSGVLLKLFDVAAKWAAIAVLLKVFTGLPIFYGVLFAGSVSIIYITIGGLWAVTVTDFIQFGVQVAAGIVMFFAVTERLGGMESIFTLWDQLPERNSDIFSEPYTVGFALAFLIINTLSYNGGTWNLATKYISSPNERDAKRAAILSGVLYFIWPLILFFPMWAAPVILPGLEDPTESYGMLTLNLLPTGMIGLVLASMFATTMSMTSSDANTIAAVITRDILPRFKYKNANSLRVARIVTFIFTLSTVIIALQSESFGGVFGLIVSWFGALIGPISVPVLLGLIPAFKICNERVAIASIALGFFAFILIKVFSPDISLGLEVSSPVLVTLIIYITYGFLNRGKQANEKVEKMMRKIYDQNDK